MPLLYFVNVKIDSLSETSIEKSLRTSLAAFESYENYQRNAALTSVSSLLSSQASIRAVLASTCTANDDLFGDSAKPDSSSLKHTHEILFSAVESLDLFQSSPVFALSDCGGRLLLSKNRPEVFGVDLTGRALIKAALDGKTEMTHWGSSDHELIRMGLVEETSPPQLFEVFAVPLMFDQASAKGLMIVGFPVLSKEVLNLTEISQSKIAFISEGTTFTSAEGIPADFAGIVEKAGSNIFRFWERGETFIGLAVPMKDLANKGYSAAVVIKSKTKELAYFSGLKRTLDIVGIVAAILALIFAGILSKEVSYAVGVLIEAVKKIRSGNFDFKVAIETKDEFNDLGNAFNEMVVGLREKEKIRQTFNRYVHPEVVSSLLSGSDKLALGGERRELVIFFSDITGFTTLAEKLPPEGTVEILNQYLSEMAGIIERNQGIVDKYVGDAIMAYWLTPASKKLRCRLACDVAIEQLGAMRLLRSKWNQDHLFANIGVRIGIHAGEALMGNIGSPERMDYTIIGDNVNTAARMESINKQYGTSIIVSDEIVDNLGSEYLFRELDRVKVLGRSAPMSIYELVGKAEHLENDTVFKISLFEKALKTYRAGDFTIAQDQFRHYRSVYPHDRPAQIYLERCSHLLENPPLEWDGIYQAKEK